MDATQLANDIAKLFGSDNDPQTVLDWLDTGYPPLNELLSGDPRKGVPYGRIMEIFGPPSAGKTWLASQIMIAAQQAGGCAMFMDHEYAYDVSLSVRGGLSTQSPYWLYDRPETWEESHVKAMRAVKMIRDSGVIAPKAPIVIVMDSVAAMIPKSMLYDNKGKRREIDEMTMNDTTALARVSSTTLKVINKLTAELNCTLIYLNQIRTKIGVVYGDPTTTPGGSSFEFYASIRLALGRKLIKEAGDDGKEVTGQLIGITTKKNKLTRPFQEIDVLLTFPDEGGAAFDRETGIISALVAKGKIPYSKPYLLWEGKKLYLSQLAKKAKEEGLYPQLVDLYLNDATAAVAA
jgi:protein RecA